MFESMDKITREEFAAACASCGYASRKAALAYAADRDKLTDDDYIEVYRLQQRCGGCGIWRGMLTSDLRKVRTTKHYMRLGADSREEDNR